MSGVPVACGALGSFDPAVLARIVAGHEVPLREVHGETGVSLWLDRDPAASRNACQLSWSETLAPGSSGAATPGEDGVWSLTLAADGRRTLHASPSGLLPLYWRRRGDTVYFASRVDSLARSGLGPVTPDWEAWASILVCSYSHSERTPFAEIRRLGPGARIELDRGDVRVEARTLGWDASGPRELDAAAEAVLAELRRVIGALDPDERLACPVTGGWDSRLLAILLAERGIATETFTINSDRGHEGDERLAPAVSRALGLPHRVIEPRPPPYAAEFAALAAALEYQSMPHFHIARLAGAVPPGTPWADGLFGDVLLQGYLLSRRRAREPDSRVALASLFDRLLARQQMGLYTPRAWRALRGTTRAALLADAEPLVGHPGGFPMLVYWTRTRRMIASAPMQLIGQSHPLVLPFVAASVIAAAGGVPLEDRFGGNLMRRILELANPTVARLPSSHDGLPKQIVRRSSQRSPAAAATHLDLMARSPLYPWFSPAVHEAIAQRDLSGLDRDPTLLLRIQGVCMLGLWIERYQDLIGDLDPAPILDRRPTATP